jgi:hypothetical protein
LSDLAKLLHLPALIGICVDLNVKSSGKELNQSTIKMLEEIGIDIKSDDRTN